MKRLTQFTRIFPPEPNAGSGGAEDDEANRDDENDEENDRDDALPAAASAPVNVNATGETVVAKNSFKPASYEDVLFQVRTVQCCHFFVVLIPTRVDRRHFSFLHFSASC